MLTCEGNNDKNLCGDHVSVSKQAKNIKILSNQGLCPYYRILYGRVKDLAREGVVDSFYISNETIKMKQ